LQYHLMLVNLKVAMTLRLQLGTAHAGGRHGTALRRPRA
jgi:hypothetical protein